jgi:peptidoglycan/xylan/chitin deacetylase (PgdA/CDA1 family)
LPADSQITGRATPQMDSHSEAARRRPLWRDAVAGGLYYSGALRALQALARHYEIASDKGRGLPHLRRVERPKFAILCYHRIGTGGIPLFNGLPPEIFEAQMRYLHRRYRIVSLDELCNEMQHRASRDHAVAVTFDDGYRDLYTYALPVLKKCNIPATIFLPVACIETGQVPWYDRIFLAMKVFPRNNLEVLLDRLRKFTLASLEARIQAGTEIVQYLRTIPDDRRKDFCRNLEGQVVLPSEELSDRMLTWDQIRTMRAAGVTFGSHTMTHPVVNQLNETHLESELRESKEILEARLRTQVRHFAFPFGQPKDCGTAALPVLVRCGYTSAATTVEGINRSGENLFALRRVQTGEERFLPMFALRLKALFLSAGSADSAIASPIPSPSHEQDLRDTGQTTNWRKRCGTSLF